MKERKCLFCGENVDNGNHPIIQSGTEKSVDGGIYVWERRVCKSTKTSRDNLDLDDTCHYCGSPYHTTSEHAAGL